MPDLLSPYLAARRRNALVFRFGLYVSPIQAGEGFCWFTDKAALLTFLGGQLWQAASGLAPTDDIQRELAGLLQDAELSNTTLDELNLILEPVCQVHWWGSLDQLCTDEDVFAKDLREAYREQAGGGPQNFGGLAAAEQADFAAFLRSMFPLQG